MKETVSQGLFRRDPLARVERHHFRQEVHRILISLWEGKGGEEDAHFRGIEKTEMPIHMRLIANEITEAHTLGNKVFNDGAVTF